jgi:hypothetical protein
MTGPEHYREAEHILDNSLDGHGMGLRRDPAERFAEAQVHATLALAAATAISHNGEMPVNDSDAWLRVAADG